MRHRKKGFKLGRTAAHRKATLSELSNALIAHKRITTTLTRAKALRMFVEPIISRAKEDTTHNRRQVFRRLHSKASVNTLFDEIAGHVRDRDGGYTRVIRLGKRHGDGSELAVIELVDYNDVKPTGASGTKKTRRTRRGGGRGRGAKAEAPATVETVVETAEVTEVEAAEPEEVAEVGEEEASASEEVEAPTASDDTDEPADDEKPA